MTQIKVWQASIDQSSENIRKSAGWQGDRLWASIMKESSWFPCIACGKTSGCTTSDLFFQQFCSPVLALFWYLFWDFCKPGFCIGLWQFLGGGRQELWSAAQPSQFTSSHHLGRYWVSTIKCQTAWTLKRGYFWTFRRRTKLKYLEFKRGPSHPSGKFKQ